MLLDCELRSEANQLQCTGDTIVEKDIRSSCTRKIAYMDIKRLPPAVCGSSGIGKAGKLWGQSTVLCSDIVDGISWQMLFFQTPQLIGETEDTQRPFYTVIEQKVAQAIAGKVCIELLVSRRRE